MKEKEEKIRIRKRWVEGNQWENKKEKNKNPWKAEAEQKEKRKKNEVE
jgi:hypothetical protein